MKSEGTPYRSKQRALAPRSDDLEWRRRVTRGLTLLLAALAAGHVGGVATGLAVRFSATTGVDWLRVCLFGLVEFAVIKSTLEFTRPRLSDSTGLRQLGWALRLSVVAHAILIGSVMVWGLLGQPSVALIVLHQVLGAVVPTLGMAYVAGRFRDLDLPQRAASSRRVAWAFAIAGALLVAATAQQLSAEREAWFESATTLRGLGGFVLLGAFLFALRRALQLRKSLKVESHDWWLDKNQLPRASWASHAQLADHRFEVMLPDGSITHFAEQVPALEWLGARGFIPVEQAVQQGLVSGLPAEVFE